MHVYHAIIICGAQNLPRVPSHAHSTEMSKSVDCSSAKAPAPASVHWSHLEPLSSKPVAESSTSSSSSLAINSADADYNPIDEEAEHAAFRDAVMAWRKASGSGQVNAGTALQKDHKPVTQTHSSASAGTSVGSSALFTSGTFDVSALGGSVTSDLMDEEAERAVR